MTTNPMSNTTTETNITPATLDWRTVDPSRLSGESLGILARQAEGWKAVFDHQAGTWHLYAPSGHRVRYNPGFSSEKDAYMALVNPATDEEGAFNLLEKLKTRFVFDPSKDGDLKEAICRAYLAARQAEERGREKGDG